LDWSFRQLDERLCCGRYGQDRAGAQGAERTRGAARGADQRRLPLQADWIGSWAAVAMAFQRAGRRGLAGDLCRDAAYEAVLLAQFNKTDRNDARGISQMMRVELYRPVHVKTLRSQKLAPPCLNFLTKKALYKGLSADSEEKREPVSDIDTAAADSLKVLDPKRPIREADIGRR
jgi:hypothetical protein